MNNFVINGTFITQHIIGVKLGSIEIVKQFDIFKIDDKRKKEFIKIVIAVLGCGLNTYFHSKSKSI